MLKGTCRSTVGCQVPRWIYPEDRQETCNNRPVWSCIVVVLLCWAVTCGGFAQEPETAERMNDALEGLVLLGLCVVLYLVLRRRRSLRASHQVAACCALPRKPCQGN